jgi:hypothetical protein
MTMIGSKGWIVVSLSKVSHPPLTGIKIEERNIDVPLVEVCDRFATIPGRDDLVTLRSQGVVQSSENFFVVINEQYFHVLYHLYHSAHFFAFFVVDPES